MTYGRRNRDQQTGVNFNKCSPPKLRKTLTERQGDYTLRNYFNGRQTSGPADRIALPITPLYRAWGRLSLHKSRNKRSRLMYSPQNGERKERS